MNKLSGFAMTEEQNKLAEEIERRRGGTDMLNSVLPSKAWDQIIAALRAEREPSVALLLRCRNCGSTNVEDAVPATEAVLERCFRALNEFDDDVDMEDYDSVAQWWQRHGGPALNAIRAALKGKGASQGADADSNVPEGYTTGEVASPEPSGEFVRVPREPTEAMVRAGLDDLTTPISYKKDVVEIYRAMLAASPYEQKG